MSGSPQSIKRIAIGVTPEVLEVLRLEAAAREMTVVEMIRQAVSEYIGQPL